MLVGARKCSIRVSHFNILTCRHIFLSLRNANMTTNDVLHFGGLCLVAPVADGTLSGATSSAIIQNLISAKYCRMTTVHFHVKRV